MNDKPAETEKSSFVKAVIMMHLVMVLWNIHQITQSKDTTLFNSFYINWVRGRIKHNTYFESYVETNLSPTQDYFTFNVDIDNLDLFVKPRSETSEHHAELKLFVNVYAVKDTVSHIRQHTMFT